MTVMMTVMVMSLTLSTMKMNMRVMRKSCLTWRRRLPPPPHQLHPTSLAPTLTWRRRQAPPPHLLQPSPLTPTLTTLTLMLQAALQESMLSTRQVQHTTTSLHADCMNTTMGDFACSCCHRCDAVGLLCQQVNVLSDTSIRAIGLVCFHSCCLVFTAI